MQVFTFAVIPAHPAQVPVLVNNMAVQGGEDGPHQEDPQVIPVRKGQSGKVRIVPCPHPRATPNISNLGLGISATAADDTFCLSPCEDFRQGY